MKQFLITLTLLFCFGAAIMVQAQSNDMVAGQEPIVVPENIQSLVEQITNAENNENWEEYTKLREEIIQAWQQVNPEVANLYRNVTDGTPDLYPAGNQVNENLKNETAPTESILFETPMESNVLWGDDVMITGGKAYDISMDISRDDDIYVAVLGRLDASSTEHDSVYIYKSTDGGVTWINWSNIFVFPSDPKFQKIELMCFDGYPGSSGDSYLLLFYLFDDGWLRVGRTLTSTPLWNYYTISGSSGAGFTTDFAVDRNYPASNYRAICLYDSATVIKSIRSEPTSNGTVWQDAVSLGLVGKDLDLCYGFSGSTYASFNGFNSGNLYAFENLNSGDPASWGSSTTLVSGATDTTRRVEIIASRETAPNNIVAVLFEKQSGTTFDIYQVMRLSGGTWGTMAVWVNVLEDKWPALYSRKVNGNQVFPGVFEQSENGNVPPRTIRYKAYNGTGWSSSIQVSDNGIDVTGIQKPEVGELAGDVPVFAYGGANYIGVYFDNFSWTPSAPIINVNPTTLDFGHVTVNTSSILTFNIQNTGTADLTVTNIISNESAFTVNLTSTTITPGNDQDVEVTFTPTLEQTYNGNIQITHNAAGSPSNVIVTGIGDPAVGVENDFNNIPDDYALLQNYPNPFNPTTTIYYGLPQESSINLVIYDVLGNEILKLAEEQKPAGYHKFTFDASTLRSGIYFYKLEAGNFVQTRKMILMK